MAETDDLRQPSAYPLTSEYIRYQAAQFPNSVAVIDHGRAFTYEAFDRDIRRLQGALAGLGVKPGELVGVELFARAGKFSSFYFHWLTLLALEDLGAVSMSFARAEFPHMQDVLRTLDLALLFPDADGVPTPRRHVMDLDWITRTMASAPAPMSPRVAGRGGDAVRIIKSSGTTGTMKCMIRSVENQEYIYRTAQFCGGYTARSRFYSAGAFNVSAYHAAAVTCIRAGGTCIYDTRPDTENVLSSYDVTHASFLVHGLMQMLEAIPDGYKKSSNLRILTIGSPVSDAVRARILDKLAAQLSETYGSNESSSISTIDRAGIGVTLPGVEVEVVDPRDVPVMGAPGLIRVRSPGCVREYLNDRAATSRMFKDGWFYPGDVGVKLGADTLRLIGRADGILNIGGLKIAPEEFEEKFLQAVPVRDVCVVTVPGPENETQVVVAVVLGPDMDEKELAARAEQVIPAFFGATRVISVSHIPRTPSGKIERHAVRRSLQDLGDGHKIPAPK